MNHFKKWWPWHCRLGASLFTGVLFFTAAVSHTHRQPLWLFIILSILSGAAVHQVFTTTLPRLIARSVFASGNSLMRTARRGLFHIAFFVLFFTLFNLGQTGIDAFKKLYLSEKTPLVGIYFFSVLYSILLISFGFLLKRVFLLRPVQILNYLIDWVALCGALLGLTLLSFQIDVYPLFFNWMVGLSLGMLFAAPDIIRLDELSVEEHSN